MKMLKIIGIVVGVCLLVGYIVWLFYLNDSKEATVGRGGVSVIRNDAVLQASREIPDSPTQEKTAQEIDRDFLTKMVAHHEQAVEMAQIVLRTTEREEVKGLADDIIKVQSREIGLMKDWLDVWYR